MARAEKRKPHVVLAHPLFPEVVKRALKPHAQVTIARDRKSLLRCAKKADAIIPLVRIPIGDDVLSHAPRLKVVGNYGVGLDNIDLAACARRGIRVVNTPRVLTRATAELTLALLLAAARRVPEGERMCREGRFKAWEPDLLLGLQLAGRHAVLVGQGRIGKETGRLFRALGMKTSFITPQTSPVRVKGLLRSAQVLSLHLPRNEKTHHWLNRSRLALLPRDSIVLNTSRGPVIDERALISALGRRRIFAAGLDVYEREPRIPKALSRLSNVVLLPHVGSATREARIGMAELVIEGVLGVLRGQRPWNEVDLSPMIHKGSPSARRR
jgi:glyoxylate reductase